MLFHPQTKLKNKSASGLNFNYIYFSRDISPDLIVQ